MLTGLVQTSTKHVFQVKRLLYSIYDKTNYAARNSFNLQLPGTSALMSTTFQEHALPFLSSIE